MLAYANPISLCNQGLPKACAARYVKMLSVVPWGIAHPSSSLMGSLPHDWVTLKEDRFAT